LQYDILFGTIFTNIHAITLLLYSNTYFFFRSVINTVKTWFFHISLLYCTRKNILIFALFLRHDNKDNHKSTKRL
jgi:hypothetical protein